MQDAVDGKGNAESRSFQKIEGLFWDARLAMHHRCSLHHDGDGRNVDLLSCLALRIPFLNGDLIAQSDPRARKPVKRLKTEIVPMTGF